MWTAFHGAREVLAVGAFGAFLVVSAYAGTATLLAHGASLFVLAEAGALAIPAIVAPLAVLTVAGAATGLALFALLAVEADAGATAAPAIIALLAVWTLFVDAPLDWMWRRGVRRCYGSCLFHAVNGDGGEL